MHVSVGFPISLQPTQLSRCSFVRLFSSFAADVETHWNYWEFSKCFPKCLGYFTGYSLSTEFYSNSTWWLGGHWQQVLVVTDRMALDDFAVSIVQVFSIGHRVLLLISPKVSQASNAHKHWKFFMPMPKDNRDVLPDNWKENTTLVPVCILKWILQYLVILWKCYDLLFNSALF